MNESYSHFKLSGRVIASNSRALPGIRLAIVDRDRLRDDLLGVGLTDERGEFRISFVSSEFNQDPFENELFPDIYIVFSIYNNGKYRVISQRDFPGLRFVDGFADIGDIVAEDRDVSAELNDGEATPGYEKRVRRLKISNELVTHCLCEMSPLVEQLTGWTGLATNAKITVTSEADRILARQFTELGLQRYPLIGRLVSRTLYATSYAFYDPLSGEIVVNETLTAHCSLDGLKIILGHELVHEGQFRHSRGLIDEYRRACHNLVDFCLTSETESISDLAATIQESPAYGIMARLEGYAYYIQKDFLEKYYNCALIIPHVSLFSHVAQVLCDLVSPEIVSLVDLKDHQYEDGCEEYRKKTIGNEVSPFQLYDSNW